MNVLRTVLFVPSRYDALGVMVFRWGIGPNGALGMLAGLADDYNERHRGRAQIGYRLFDEHVERAVTPALLRRWRDESEARGERFVLMVCSIHTNNYPRGRDVALMARREGITVIAGGIHLSSHAPSVDTLCSAGVSVGLGEAEAYWDRLIDDALDARLRPIYRPTAEGSISVATAVTPILVPELERQPFPHVSTAYLRRFVTGRQISIDSSRGCPFICSFCAVKNAFGRVVRSRDPERLARFVADRYDGDGVHGFGFSDDNFVRSPRHREVLEALAEVRKTRPRLKISMMVDVEAACHATEASERGRRAREFVDGCRRAGVVKVCLGLESTNDGALREMRKNVNRARGVAEAEAHDAILRRYRAAVEAFQSAGVHVECSMILGFDADGPDAGERAARDMHAVGADLAHFALLTPIPGSEDYASALTKRTLLDTSFNDYFYAPVRRHPRLRPAEQQKLVDDAYASFFTWRRVASRVARGTLGIGRPRVRNALRYVSRQLGAKLLISFGRFSYFQGGMWRRPAPADAGRVALSDEEARRVHGPPLAHDERGPAAEVERDPRQMRSLPLLSHHDENIEPAIAK